jgi:long-chain acyl-CoA synthetase
VLLATSGTTGQPKFVAHTPATLSAVANICAHLELNRGHIAVHAMPMTHAIGLFTFLACVRFGNPMLLFERFNSDAVLDAIEPHHCSWMLGAPVMFADMLERQRAYSRKVDSLRVCLTVGDVWPPELQQEFQHVFGLPLRPFWSSTETGPLAYELQPGPVNRIARGAQVRLVDDDGATAARGEMGELLVRGPNVAVGYWAGPSRIDDATFDGWFHTGDLVRQGDGEDFWFISRKKDLIVSGGSNISPVEVERVLMAHHAVLDAAVIGVPDAVLGQRVAAFVQLAGDPSGAVVDDILGWAKAQLAGHKVPEWLELIDEIPKNAFGKANRVLLAAMLSHIPVSEAAPVMSS